jgi:hypothetical protein
LYFFSPNIFDIYLDVRLENLVVNDVEDGCTPLPKKPKMVVNNVNYIGHLGCKNAMGKTHC